MNVTLKNLFLVGLTGGIGSGKSSVAALFRLAGWPTLDTDELTHDLLDCPDPQLFEQLVRRFGPDILEPYGSVSRKALGLLVFSDPKARQDLEALLHPAIERAMYVQMARLIAGGSDRCLVEIPLLVEAGWDKKVHFVVTVEASPELQIERASMRLGITPQQVQDRMAHQATSQQRRAVANFVLMNQGSLKDLEAQFPACLQAIESAMALTRSRPS